MLAPMSAAPIPTARPTLAATAAETTPENPWPLRLLNSKITEYVARMVPLWVEGQLVQINRRPGQNLVFMTLRDADVDMSISVVIQTRDLLASTAAITEGARVVLRARPTFWPKRGTLQLQASEVRPVGLGQLLARIQQLKRVLAGEGLFAAERKVPLPFLPHRIGLICGRESKAEQDVVVNARARWPQVRFEIREVAVQGAHAVAEVCEALAALDADPAVDVIIVARGGGSVEDLLPFSNEHLVRVAAACRTPIVSAIGHEADSPLLDLVADHRASTPTDAAKRVVPDVAEESRTLVQARARMRAAVAARLTREHAALTALRSRPVLADPTTVVDRNEERLATARRELRRGFVWHLDRARAELDRLRSQCVAMSPAATLERGYAVVRDGAGHVLQDAAEVALGTRVEILLAAGRLDAEVTGVRPASPQPTPTEGA